MEKPFRLLMVIAAGAVLGGCTSSDLERAGVGAAIGGATALVVNGSLATGVVVGAAGGALCDDVNLC